ncbi:MAG: hypothetical protein ACI4KM_11685 [Oscillospiraceae bacterium]
MNKAEFKQAYGKISLSPEFAAQAKAKLIMELSAPKTAGSDNDTISLQEPTAEVNPRAKIRRRIGLGIGAAAAVLAIAAGVRFVPWGDFVGNTSSDISSDTVPIDYDLGKIIYYKCGWLSYGKLESAPSKEAAVGTAFESGEKALEFASALLGTEIPEGTVFYDPAADHGDSWTKAEGSFEIIPEKSGHTSDSECSIMLESGKAWIRADIVNGAFFASSPNIPDNIGVLLTPESYANRDFLTTDGVIRVHAARGELDGIMYYTAEFIYNKNLVELSGADCTEKQFADAIAMLIYGESMPEAPEGAAEIAASVSGDFDVVFYNKGYTCENTADMSGARSMTEDDYNEMKSYIDLDGIEFPASFIGMQTRTVKNYFPGKAYDVTVKNGEQFVRVSAAPTWYSEISSIRDYSAMDFTPKMSYIERNMEFGILPPVYSSEITGCSEKVYFAMCEGENHYLAGWYKNSEAYIVVEANVNDLSPEEFAEFVQSIAGDRTQEENPVNLEGSFVYLEETGVGTVEFGGMTEKRAADPGSDLVFFDSDTEAVEYAAKFNENVRKLGKYSGSNNTVLSDWALLSGMFCDTYRDPYGQSVTLQYGNINHSTVEHDEIRSGSSLCVNIGYDTGKFAYLHPYISTEQRSKLVTPAAYRTNDFLSADRVPLCIGCIEINGVWYDYARWSDSGLEYLVTGIDCTLEDFLGTVSTLLYGTENFPQPLTELDDRISIINLDGLGSLAANTIVENIVSSIHHGHDYESTEHSIEDMAQFAERSVITSIGKPKTVICYEDYADHAPDREHLFRYYSAYFDSNGTGSPFTLEVYEGDYSAYFLDKKSAKFACLPPVASTDFAGGEVYFGCTAVGSGGSLTEICAAGFIDGSKRYILTAQMPVNDFAQLLYSVMTNGKNAVNETIGGTLHFSEGTIEILPLDEKITQSYPADAEFFEPNPPIGEKAAQARELCGAAAHCDFESFGAWDSELGGWQLINPRSYKAAGGMAMCWYNSAASSEMYLNIRTGSGFEYRRVGMDFDDLETAFAPSAAYQNHSEMITCETLVSGNYFEPTLCQPFVAARKEGDNIFCEASWGADNNGERVTFLVSMRCREITELTDIMAEIMYGTHSLTEITEPTETVVFNRQNVTLNPMRRDVFGADYVYDVVMKQGADGCCPFCEQTHDTEKLCTEALNLLTIYTNGNTAVVDLARNSDSARLTFGCDFIEFHQTDEDFGNFVNGRLVSGDAKDSSTQKALEESLEYKTNGGRTYTTNHLTYLQTKHIGFAHLSLTIQNAGQQPITVDIAMLEYRNISRGLNFQSYMPTPSAEFCADDIERLPERLRNAISPVYIGIAQHKYEYSDSNVYYGAFRDISGNYISVNAETDPLIFAEIMENIYKGTIENYCE